MTPNVPFASQVHAYGRKLFRRASQLYQEQIDLQPVGVAAILFLSCRYNGNHKLSFLRTATLSLSQITAMTEQIFECDSRNLRLARVDFAVDLSGVSIDWARTHVRVSRKRVSTNSGGRRYLQSRPTLYFGCTSDLFRIYDKQAERLSRRGETRSHHDSRVGLVESSADCLTRVERQIRRTRIPHEISTLEQLSLNALNFDPFAPLIVHLGGKPELDIRKYAVNRYLEGIGFRTLITELGLAAAWHLISRGCGGNARRVFDRLADFVPTTPETVVFPDLFAMHQRSIRPQLNQSLGTHE